jgi:hypothetical protein
MSEPANIPVGALTVRALRWPGTVPAQTTSNVASAHLAPAAPLDFVKSLVLVALGGFSLSKSTFYAFMPLCFLR